MMFFSIIMLNQDLHLPSIRKNAMDKKTNLTNCEQFTRRLKGVVDDQKFLVEVYESVREVPLSIGQAQKEGWLSIKQGWFGMKTKVWCVVKGPCLYYFANATGRAKGMITLPSYTITPSTSIHPFAFSLTHPSAPEYVFSAHNQQDMLSWVSALDRAAQLTPPAPAKLVETSASKFIVQKESPLNQPLPANAFIKYNIFDVKIMRKPNQIIGLDIKVNRDNGTIVSKVHEDSPASACGQINPGDQIVKIDGRTISGMTSSMVIGIMKELKDTVVFSIRRFND